MKKNENHRRLRWKCRRGMLELDLLLLPFLDKHYVDLPEHEKQVFERLLEEEDPVLQSWFMRQAIPDNQEMATMVETIRRAAL